MAAENAALKALRSLGERTEGEVRGILAAVEAWGRQMGGGITYYNVILKKHITINIYIYMHYHFFQLYRLFAARSPQVLFSSLQPALEVQDYHTNH